MKTNEYKYLLSRFLSPSGWLREVLGEKSVLHFHDWLLKRTFRTWTGMRGPALKNESDFFYKPPT